MAWQFWDPATDETYTPPFGPHTYTSPHPERVLTDRATTSHNGRILTFEGEPRQRVWTLTGRTLAEAHHNALAYWAGKKKRIVVTDEQGRSWVCLPLSFNERPKRAYMLPWSFEYTLRLQMFGRYQP